MRGLLQFLLCFLPFLFGFAVGRSTVAPAPAWTTSTKSSSKHSTVETSNDVAHNNGAVNDLVRVKQSSMSSLSDILLVTTLDGTLHAVDISTGAVLWSKQDSWGPLVKVLSPKDLTTKKTGNSGLGGTLPDPSSQFALGGMSTPASDDDNGMFLVEPIGDGDLYYMESGSNGVLRKLPFPIKKIVDGSSPVISPKLVSTKKIEERVLALDPYTGEIMLVFGEGDEMADEHLVGTDAIHVRRTQYTLSMQEKATGRVRWNITYAEYDVIQNDVLLDFDNFEDRFLTNNGEFKIMADRFGVLSVHNVDSWTQQIKFPSPVSSAFHVNYGPHGPILSKAYPPAKVDLETAPNGVAPVNIRHIDGVDYVFSNNYPRLESTADGFGDSRERMTGGSETVETVSGSGCWKEGKLMDCPTFAIQPTTTAIPPRFLAPQTAIATPIDPPPSAPRLQEGSKAEKPNINVQYLLTGVSLCALAVFCWRWLLGRKAHVVAKEARNKLPITDPSREAARDAASITPATGVEQEALVLDVTEASATPEAPSTDTTTDLQQVIDIDSAATLHPPRPRSQEDSTFAPSPQFDNAILPLPTPPPSASPSPSTPITENPPRETPKRKRNRNKNKKEKGASVKIVEPEPELPNEVTVGQQILDIDGSVSQDTAPRTTPALESAAPARVSALGHVGLRALKVTDTILGYGSHGTVVYKGSFEGRDVAVKRLLLDFYDVADHEVKILQDSDDHPNVVRYFCKERSEGFMYIALELCPASLADVIEKTNSELCTGLRIVMRPPQVLHQIIAGIHHLHQLKIVHRDIKPHNILVSNPKSRKSTHPRILISDFGLGKRLADDQSSFHNTHMTAGGTVGWRAPECMLNPTSNPSASESDKSDPPSWVALSSGSSEEASKPLGPKITKAIDIFSAGCVFYYVLTGGMHPFGDRFVREMNIMKGNFRLDRLDAFGEEGVEAKDLIRRMIAKDPKKRPDASTVLMHPYFWTPSQRLAFLQDASDRFEIEERDPPSPLLKVLERSAAKVVGPDWYRRIDRMLLDNLGKYRKYDGGSIRDLLRALRNKKHHYQDLPEDVKRALGSLPEGFLTYFTSRFPLLLLHIYYVVADGKLRHEPMFQPYFRHPESIY